MNTKVILKNKHIFIACAFVLVNLMWKFLSINALPVDHDEPFTIFYSQMDIIKMYKYLSEGENNPLFFESILHFWIKIFGISPISVRTLSVLFSSVTVYFIYQLCRKNFSTITAVLASIIFTCSNYHLGFSHEARTYAMFAFYISVSMYLFLEFIKNPNKRNLWLLGIINIFLIYSHFFALFIPFVQLLCCLICNDLRKKVIVMYLLSSLITLVGFAPMLFVLIHRFVITASQGTWLTPIDFGELHHILQLFSNGKALLLLVGAIWLTAAILYLVNKRTKLSDPTILMILWFFVPFITMFIISTKYIPYSIPMFLDRYLIHTSLPFFILTAMALDFLGSNLKIKWIALVGYIVFSIFMIKSMHWPTDTNKIRELIGKVNENKTDKTLICLAPAYYAQIFSYNYDRDYFNDIDNEKPFENLIYKLNDDNIYPIYNFEGINKDALKDKPRVIYIDIAAKFLFPQNAIIDSLSKTATNIQTFPINDNRDVWVFDYNMNQ